ncbi:hypothetical protein FB451DRAFT_1261443 [Mycena latifolia]|nr:hypothetical protein FB451DRAFT_1261443 [Mycena latifolia]
MKSHGQRGEDSNWPGDTAESSLFSHSRNFTINGGVFNAVVHKNTSESRLKSGLRSICMGDLHLLSETKQFNIVQMRAVRRRKTGDLLRYEPQTIGMRTIYRVRVFGSTHIMTAVVYHGAQSEQWREMLCRAPGIRHPNILQLFGVTSSHDGLDALLYHDDFVPVSEVRKKHRELPLASCYSEYSMQNELANARLYWLRATGQLLVPEQYTVWIRRSTGRLCLDVSPSQSDFEDRCEIQWKTGSHLAPELSMLSSENMDVRCLTRSLELEDIHVILGHLPRWESSLLMTQGQGSLSVGSVLGFAAKPDEAQLGSVLELACFPACETEFFAWDEWPGDFNGELMSNGWTRFDLPGRTLGVHHIESSLKISQNAWKHAVHSWLSQANHVFSILDNNSRSVQRHSCVLVKDIEFSLSIWYPEDEYTLDGTFMTGSFPEKIYLFACPLDARQVGGRQVLLLPPSNEAFYWSLDPLGADKLTSEEAEKFSLPNVSFAVRLWGCSWNETQYDVLRHFYLNKGYNPASTDATHALHYPLLQVHDESIVVSSKGDIQLASERDERVLSTYPSQDEWCLLWSVAVVSPIAVITVFNLVNTTNPEYKA